MASPFSTNPFSKRARGRRTRLSGRTHRHSLSVKCALRNRHCTSPLHRANREERPRALGCKSMALRFPDSYTSRWTDDTLCGTGLTAIDRSASSSSRSWKDSKSTVTRKHGLCEERSEEHTSELQSLRHLVC